MEEFVKLKLDDEKVRLCGSTYVDPQCPCPKCESYYDELGDFIEKNPIGFIPPGDVKPGGMK